MKRILLSCVMISAVASVEIWAADGDLWSRAQTIFLSNTTWMPGTMAITSREMDRDGFEKSVEQSVYRITTDTTGVMQSELTYAEKDGKDITEKQARRGGSRGGPPGRGDENSSATFPIPLDPALADQVTWTQTNETQYVNGKSCRGFSYELDDGEGNIYVGMIWIDQTTAVPLQMTAGMAKLPKFVDSFMMSFYYNDDPEAWYATEGHMDGKATILVMKRQFSVSMVFEDYFRSP